MTLPFFSSRAKKAAALLICVLVIGAIALVVSMNVALMGMGEMVAGTSESQSLKASAAVEACAEEALLRFSQNYSYTGGALAVGNASCSVSVTGTTPKSVSVVGSVGVWTRKLLFRVSNVGGLTVLSWKQDPS